MGQYSSYYLYQKYEKRGEQDWIPCYPNTYSISGDSSNPMTLVMKSSADTECGYVPKGSDDYNYEKWEVVDGYICDDTTKYARERKYVSDDNVNWTATDIYRRSETILGTNSTDCGYDPQWDAYNCHKWEVVSNDYICNEGNKYQKLRKYFRQCENCNSCSSEWLASNIYKQGNLISNNSSDCGYITGGTREYRWINLNPSTDYYCEECGYVPSTGIYRWVSCDGQYVCVGTDKYNKLKKQYLLEDDTWADSDPLETKAGDILVQSNSSDCGGSTAPVSTFKLATYVTGESKQIPCDTGGVITRNEVQEYYYGQYAHWESLSIGDCVSEIGDYALQGFASSRIYSINLYSKIPPLLSPLSCLGDIVTVYPSTKPPIIVPSESVNLYKTSPTWSHYANRIQGRT